MTELSNLNKSKESLSPLLSASWQGAFWKIVSCAAFAGINGIVRYLAGGSNMSIEDPLPTNVIFFFQNIFGVIFLAPLFYQQRAFSAFTRHSQYFGLHILRVMAAVLGIALWYLTLRYMPIAEGVALTFTGPVFTVIGASLLLGERLGSQRRLSIGLSLLAAFIISRPDLAFSGGGSLGWSVLFPLASALVLAWNKLLTRQLANKGASPEILAMYLLFFMVPLSLVPALFEWKIPTLAHWPWLILLGILASIAHLAFGKAYKLAEVTFLTPFGFSKFLFSALIGYLCFLEMPSLSLFIGMILIGLSILLLAYKISLYSAARRFKSSWLRNSE